VIIERLSRAHDRARFDCGIPDLNRFLRELARQDSDRDLGITYIAVDDEESARVLGYYTLTMSEVARQIVPQRNLPPERSVPVTLLGRLAVDRSCQGRGIGETLLFDALHRVQNVSSQLGVFAVVVDAIDERARGFYSRYGFEQLSDDPLHLYLSLKEIRKLGLAPAR
jgi:predicted GNAT family N-acyltransferase